MMEVRPTLNLSCGDFALGFDRVLGHKQFKHRLKDEVFYPWIPGKTKLRGTPAHYGKNDFETDA